MPLTPGTRFGAYEITSPLGAGGMGEVYRATDTRLKRDVAIKVLPAALAGDPDRLARFQREAEVLASVNHPHIAAIYGLEEKDGERALVMELVEGDDLSRLVTRPGSPEPALSVPDALAIAKQIAEAVEAAHELGIIHRDLKPSNVKVRPDGTVKVLDFGLAKLTEPIVNTRVSGSLSMSPTITTPAMTGMGIILGTAAYMSPEQARGRVVDKRTDIWAFGAVLYEMLTGRRAFDGEDASLTLAAVMKSDPDFSALPHEVPASIRTCLVRCLHKDPRQRVRDMGDVRLMLDGAFDSPAQASGPAAPAAPPRASFWRRVAPPLAAATVAGTLVGVVAWTAKPADPPRPVTRFEHVLPAEVVFRTGARRSFTVSPDGAQIAYSAVGGLYLHALDEVGDRRLIDSAVQVPEFSADGNFVAYYQNGQLKRIAVSGGAPVVIADSFNPAGMSWGPDNTLLFAVTDGIRRVPADGGAPELVVKAGDGEAFSSPQLLPGGDTLLFTVTETTGMIGTPNAGGSRAVLHSLRSRERTVLVRGAADAMYLPSGHLLYTVDDELFGIGLDLAAHKTVGGAVSLVEGIRRGASAMPLNLAEFDVSERGTLFYVTGSSAIGGPLVWLDRTGRPEVVTSIAPQDFSHPRLSADGRRVLVTAQGDLRIYDLATGRETRITSDRAAGGYNEWVPGDRAVVYSSRRKGEGGLMNVWLQPLDGSGRATQLTKVEGQMHVDGWSPDGRTLAAHRHSLQGAVDLLVVPVTDGAAGEPKPFRAEPASEESAVFSPDGRYLAYLDAVSGQNELVIRPFPGPGPETPVSVGGAREPAWAKNGELFYRRTSDDMMMVVRVTTSPALSVGPPQDLFRGSGVFEASPRAGYAVTADGQRFLTNGVRVGSGLRADAAAPRPRINVVLNWVEELKRRVPIG